MNNQKLIEIHILQNHAASNLNRDDTGSVKDVVFGGVPRARISSQCIKRSIRTSDTFYEYIEKDKLGIRTKYLPEEIKQKLISKGITEKEANEFADKIMSIGGGKGKAKEEHKLTSQIIFLSYQNIETIVKNFEELKDLKEKDLATAIRDILEEQNILPVDIALFGRMTTNEPIKDVNACCQVAHAFSVNKHKKEFDYFTALDDLSDKYSEDPGAGHLGETEFTSACFYKYFSIDYSSLVDLLKGNQELAKTAICALLKAASFANPTGKQNSFASHTLPHFIGIEIKSRKIPVNYCNAFIDPIKENENWFEKSTELLCSFAKITREKYSLPIVEKAFLSLTEKGKEFGEVKNNMDDLENWLKVKLNNG